MSVNMEKAAGTADLAADLGIAYTIPRVNLPPPEITAARTFRRTQAGLGACAVLVVAAIVGVFVLSQRQANQSAENLAAEQSTTSSLQAQQAEYAQVPIVLAQVEAAEAARETAMGSDVLWYRYLNDLASTYPPNVWLGGMTATIGSPTVATVLAPSSTDPLATPGIGTISFTGTGLTNPDVASWLDVLAATPGFADASLTSATRAERGGQTVVDFATQVVVTDEAKSHRFDRKAS